MSDLIQAFPNKMHPMPELTDREIQLLELIERGHQNKEIAHTAYS
jgi:DNA-binding NarL/FixJ family response regulator